MGNLRITLLCFIEIFIFAPFFQLVSAQSNIWNLEVKFPYKFSNNEVIRNPYRNSIITIGGSVPVNVDRKFLFESTINSNGSLSPWNLLSSQLKYPVIWNSVESVDNKVFSVGGFNEVNSPNQFFSSNSVLETSFDVTGTLLPWQELQFSLPDYLALGDTEIFNSKLFYFGGATWGIYGNPIIKNKIYSINVNSGNLTSGWEEAGELPGYIFGHKVININNNFYLIGGYYDDTHSAENKIYKAVFDENSNIINWEESVNSLPAKIYDFMMVRFGDYLIVVGGRGPRLDDPTTYDHIFYSKIDPSGNLGEWKISQIKLPSNNCCAGMVITNNKIYLVGGHDGRDYFDSVWSIDPSIIINGPIPTPIPSFDPIIFIPGMGGTWSYDLLIHPLSNPNAKWSLNKIGRDTYNNLLNSIIENGYELNKNLFVFSYDWRKNVVDNGQELVNFISNIQTTSNLPGAKFILIGHSMGGLIGRSALTYNSENIQSLITIGTPHKGTTLSYYVWEGGDTSKLEDPMSITLDLFSAVNANRYGGKVNFFQSQIPSLLNLFPTWNFLLENNGKIIPISKMYWKNNLIPSLDTTLDNTKSMIGSVAGTEIPTGKFIMTEKRNLIDMIMGRWKDGRPVGSLADSGDGTVLQSSAIIDGGWKSISYPNLDHGMITSNNDPVNKILNWINLDGGTNFDSNLNYFRTIIFTIASPATYKIISPEGNIYIPEDGLVIINEPSNGEYTIELTSTDVGKVTTYTGVFENGRNYWTTKEFQFDQIGKITDQEITVDFDEPFFGFDPINEIDENVEIIKTALKSSVYIKIIKEINNLIVALPNQKKETLVPHTEKLLHLLDSTRMKLGKENYNANIDVIVRISKIMELVDEYYRWKLSTY